MGTHSDIKTLGSPK